MTGLVKAIHFSTLLVAFLFPAFAAAQDEQGQGEQADDPQPISFGDNAVDGRFAGVAGGAIAGAEIIVAVEAIAGVEKLWPYLTFPLLGAAGGGVGGYFLGKASPKGAIALLVGSMALIIPTAILASSARAYDPEEEGAIGSDTGDEDKFSFELSPTGDAQGGTSTEVESRPEGAPTNTVLPPGAEQPGGESESEPSESQPDGEEAPVEEDTTPSGASARKDSKKRLARNARIRRASAGSLFYVDNDGTAAISVPFVDVRPVTLSSENTVYGNRQAIEVFVTLLRVDLP